MSNQIYTAMAKILQEIGAVEKGKVADMGFAGKYKFRGIDDMYNALHEIFAKNEVFIIPKVIDTKLEIQDKGTDPKGNPKFQYSTILTMEFTFTCSDGSNITATGVGHALDTGDKGTNKAQSSALKYCLMQTFLIPTEEDKDVENGNLEAGKTKTSSQKPPEPPKTQSEQDNIATGIINKIKTKTPLDFTKASEYLEKNKAEILPELYKEATTLILENKPK